MSRRRTFVSSPQGRVCIIGAGIQGCAAARYLLGQGCEVDVVDDAEPDTVRGVLADAGLDETLFRGKIDVAPSLGADAMVLSPGVPRSLLTLQKLVARRTLVLNEAELGAARFPNATFVGVTGSNGKSTTVSMLGEVARKVHSTVFVGGNLGTPLLAYDGPAPDAVILELSSYQLETIEALDLDAAVVTNLSPDHLDRYPDVSDYYAAKMNIFGLAGAGAAAVFGADDTSEASRLETSSHHLSAWRFGVSASGAQSVRVEPPMSLVTTSSAGDATTISLNNPNIIGAHNALNAACTAAVAAALGWSLTHVAEGLAAYGGLAHRMERAGVVDGVTYINDSKATNVDAAVRGVASVERGLHLIAGGVGKGASYAPLVDAAAGRLQKVYAIGEDAPLLIEAFGADRVVAAGTLDVALDAARDAAAAGDTVLLSPACASFDQFQNFEHRGHAFCAQVRAFAQKSAETQKTEAK